MQSTSSFSINTKAVLLASGRPIWVLASGCQVLYILPPLVLHGERKREESSNGNTTPPALAWRRKEPLPIPTQGTSPRPPYVRDLRFPQPHRLPAPLSRGPSAPTSRHQVAPSAHPQPPSPACHCNNRMKRLKHYEHVILIIPNKLFATK